MIKGSISRTNICELDQTQRPSIKQIIALRTMRTAIILGNKKLVKYLEDIKDKHQQET